MILAGWSAYPRFLDFERFRAIADEVGALADGRHGALRRPRRRRHASEPGAVRRRRDQHGPQDARRRPRRPHPVQGGVRQEDQLRGVPRPAGRPARARRSPARRSRSRSPPTEAFKRAPGAHRRRREGRRRRSCSAPGTASTSLTGGTDVHLVLVDLRDSELDGQMAEDRLHEIGITVNRNAVPFDPRPPMVSSGLRVGASALATRGVQADDFQEIGRIIATALTPDVRRRPRRPRRAGHRDRRALPALRAPGDARLRVEGRRRPPRLLVAFVVATALTARWRRRRAAPGWSTSRASAAWRSEPTPLLGGLAIFAGVLVAGLLFLPDADRWHAVLAGATVITIVGAIDDWRDLPAVWKLAGQFAAGADPGARRRRRADLHAAVHRARRCSATRPSR